MSSMNDDPADPVVAAVGGLDVIDNDDDEETGGVGEKYGIIGKEMTLYDEVMDALHVAFLMFCIPDLKALAQEGVLQGDASRIQRIIDPPVTMYDVLHIYKENKALLTDERLKCEDRAEMYHEALSLERFQEIESPEMRDEILRNMKLIYLEDENEEEEAVYAIGVNLLSKRVTVAFRGSVTNKDFKQDAKALLTGVDNPIKVNNKVTTSTTDDDESINAKKESLPDKVGLHLGFKEYLYGTAADEKVNKTPKYKFILDKVSELLAEHPECKMRIVGHSLGGALTTVMALEAAGDERIPSPITAITSGAPKVGNLSFLQTFEYLEETGRIRCIQVANNKDPVTQSPPIGNFDPCGPIFCRWRIFRHVGLRLLLIPTGFMIWYPMRAQSYPGILVFDWMYVGKNCAIFFCACILLLFCCNILAVLVAVPLCFCGTYRFLIMSRQHHTQLKYIRRVEFCKDEMEKLKLDDLNNERFGRSVYRSRVLATHKTKIKFDSKMYDSTISKFSSLQGSGSKNKNNKSSEKRKEG